MSEAACMTLAEIRWKCEAHHVPEAGPDDPQYLFTRGTNEAIGVAHYREITEPFAGVNGIDCSPELWRRARFLGSALACVFIVLAPDGVYFATIKDFDKDAIVVRPRQLGIDSRAKVVIPRDKFKELKPEGAKIGPGIRAV